MDSEGNKTGGRQKGSLNKATNEIKALLDSEVDFSVVISKLFELVEGIEVQEKNSKGEDVIYSRPPDTKAAEILLSYRYGKPAQRVDVTSDGEKVNFAPQIILKPDNEV